MQPEARLVKRIIDYLKGRGCYVMKIHGGDNPFQAAGLLDIYCCYRGWFIGIEAKTPVGGLSKLQEKTLRDIEAAGGCAAVVTSVEEVTSLLSKLERER